MNTALYKYLPLLLLNIAMLAVAADDDHPGERDGWCAPKVHHRLDGDVRVWQHRFDDGTFDLAIAKSTAGVAGTPGHITRLSFKGSKEPACHFPAYSVVPGGDWGWHVAWSSSARPGVYYTRVDGAAWVSSPPKKISDHTSDIVELEQKGDLLVLKYRESSAEVGNSKRPLPAAASTGMTTLVSADEGRNWDLPAGQ